MVGADEAAIVDVCARLLGRAVVRIDRIHGGRNSQVFRLDCGGGAQPRWYVAKQYFTVPSDSRDRQGTEFRALQFLRSRGVGAVAAPIAMDGDSRCAIYECLPGERASLRAAGDDDIQQAVRFLAALRAVARRSAADDAPAASEACFSIDAIADNVSARMTRLAALPDAPGVDELRVFMTARLKPFYASLTAWTQEQARAHGIRPSLEIPLPDRTLSPSDFGFHNALRDERGRLAFVDFEYFGWDDPAKTIADFLLHPAMEMTSMQRRAFVAGVLEAFADVTGLETRAPIVYPWFGLKWCLILLNEFVPEDLQRRRFAGAADTSRLELLHGQLDRAGRLLECVDAEYRHNPYFDR